MGGPKPDALDAILPDAWRTCGDTVERLEALSIALLDGDAAAPGAASLAVLEEILTTIAPRVAACGPAEGAGLLRGLAGQFVAPAPSGAPTRGRLDVLPTGGNFYSVDARAVPTPTAWKLGWKSANLLIEKHLQDPRRLAKGDVGHRMGHGQYAHGAVTISRRPWR